MHGRDEAQGERHWPRFGQEDEARRNYPADWQRYDFAATRVAGFAVLDCACGAGYGSALLAKGGATKVVGLDVALDAIDWARREFSGPRTEFRQVVGDRLPVSDGEFDCVVSLETIEHVSEAGAPTFVAELARALRPNGRLILSTPITYGQARFHPKNPFHLREYTPDELQALLSTHFVIEERQGHHSHASRKFGNLARTPGIGSLIRRRIHRIVPTPIRRLLRELLLESGGPNSAGWITAERWREASVQIVIAHKE